MQITSRADEHAHFLSERCWPRVWQMVSDRHVDDAEVEELVTLELEARLGAEESAHSTRKAVRQLRGGQTDRHFSAEENGLERMRRTLEQRKAPRLPDEQRRAED